MNKNRSPSNTEADLLTLNGITIEFALDGDDEKSESKTNTMDELEGISIKSITVGPDKSSRSPPRDKRRAGSTTPPRGISRQGSSSTRNSVSTRGTIEGDASNNNDSSDSSGKVPNINKNIAFRRSSSGTSPSRRASVSTRPTVSSSDSSVMTERSNRSFESRGSHGSHGSAGSGAPRDRRRSNSVPRSRSKPSSGGSVYTSKTAKTVGSAKTSATGKTNNSDNTAASDADKAQRRIDREKLNEKKRAHEERRNATTSTQQRRPQLTRKIESMNSERSMDMGELNNSPASEGVNGHNSMESLDSNGASKSILKQGRFSASANGSKKVGRAHSISFDGTNSGGVRFQESTRDRLNPQKKMGVTFSGQTLVHGQGGNPRGHPQHRGPMPQRGDPRMINDPRMRQQQHPSQDGRYYEAEDAAMRGQRRMDSHQQQHYEQQRRRGPPQQMLQQQRGDPRGDPRNRSAPPGQLLSPRPMPGRGQSSQDPRMMRGNPQQAPGNRPRQMTQREQDQVKARDMIQQQQQQKQQMQLEKQQKEQQQQQKAQSKGKFFGRNKSPPVEEQQLTHTQLRMAAAQAAFATVGDC